MRGQAGNCAFPGARAAFTAGSGAMRIVIHVGMEFEGLSIADCGLGAPKADFRGATRLRSCSAGRRLGGTAPGRRKSGLGSKRTRYNIPLEALARSVAPERRRR